MLKVNSAKLAALIKVAEYIIDCESNEYDSYVTYCEENDLDPKDIKGKGQSGHVYALALIGLSMEFPSDDTDKLELQADCEHTDLDDAQCLDCGADLTETLASQAYDRAKDRRKYGE